MSFLGVLPEVQNPLLSFEKIPDFQFQILLALKNALPLFASFMRTVKDGWRLSLGAKSFDSISITFLQDSNLSAEEKKKEQKLILLLTCF